MLEIVENLYNKHFYNEVTCMMRDSTSIGRIPIYMHCQHLYSVYHYNEGIQAYLTANLLFYNERTERNCHGLLQPPLCCSAQ